MKNCVIVHFMFGQASLIWGFLGVFVVCLSFYHLEETKFEERCFIYFMLQLKGIHFWVHVLLEASCLMSFTFVTPKF